MFQTIIFYSQKNNLLKNPKFISFIISLTNHRVENNNLRENDNLQFYYLKTLDALAKFIIIYNNNT